MASTTDREPRLRARWLALLAVVALLSVYGAAAAVGGFGDTWALVRSAKAGWLLPAALAEVGSYLGWVVLLRAVTGDEHMGWSESTRITLAGVAATRLLAAAGAGGVALTAWALRRLGLGAAHVARSVAALLVAIYGVYLAALALVGVVLYARGTAPASLSALPAALATGAMVTVVVLAATTTRPHRSAAHGAARARWLVAAGPRLLGEGLRRLWALARRREFGLAGAAAWWACDLFALWCCFRAFGATPALGVLALAYLLGQLGNLLPLPGGVGGIDGAMIGALIALGTTPGDAALAVLAYRGISFWLPTVPGVLAYVSLRRRRDTVDG